ncbi:hypothetical protein QUA13_20015 [Microcoleus sp. S28C3]
MSNESAIRGVAIDPVTGEALEPTNALYIACEHPPYNDAKLYE